MLERDPALADLVPARKAEKETLRGRLQEYKPTSQRLKLAQDARDKAARKHRQVGEELEALRLRLDAMAQAWREATIALGAGSAGSGYVGCQIAARARASQRGYDADAWEVSWYGHSFGRQV